MPQRDTSTMFKAVLLQLGATLIAVAIAGMLAGMHGAVSTALGGLAVCLPSLLFAVRLRSVSRKAGASYPAEFFIGELIKVASTVVLLIAAVHWYSELHWISLFAGLIVALQGNLFAFLMKT